MIRNRGVTRYSKAGLLLTRHELRVLTDETRTQAADFPTRAEEAVRAVAEEARDVGRVACSNESCRLSVAGLCLFESVGVIDAEIRPQCDVNNCRDEGIDAAERAIIDATQAASQRAAAYPDC